MDNEKYVIDRIEKVEKDISEIYSRLNAHAIEQATTSTKLDAALVTLGEIKATVIALQSKPGKRWDTLISALVSAIIAGVVGYFIASIK